MPDAEGHDEVDVVRRFIFFANRGPVRYSDHEDQTTQAHCHTLVVARIVRAGQAP